MQGLEFDPVLRMFILTEEEMRKAGVDIQSRLGVVGNTNKDAVIKQFLKQVSFLIYSKIRHNAYLCDNNTIAQALLKEALIEQAIYVLANGDLSKSTDPQLRAIAIAPAVDTILSQPIGNSGISLLYCGV